MTETVQNRINQYLKDTIAAERNFEKTLATFGSAGEQTVVQTMLAAASDKAKTQHERLEALLAKRGGTPSEGKTLLAEMLSRLEERCDLLRIACGDSHLRHGCAGMDPLWMLNPEDQIIGRVLQRSSEIGTLAEVKERWPDFAYSPWYSGNDMASRAAIMNHENRSGFGMTHLK